MHLATPTQVETILSLMYQSTLSRWSHILFAVHQSILTRVETPHTHSYALINTQACADSVNSPEHKSTLTPVETANTLLGIGQVSHRWAQSTFTEVVPISHSPISTHPGRNITHTPTPPHAAQRACPRGERQCSLQSVHPKHTFPELLHTSGEEKMGSLPA